MIIYPIRVAQYYLLSTVQERGIYFSLRVKAKILPCPTIFTTYTAINSLQTTQIEFSGNPASSILAVSKASLIFAQFELLAIFR